MAHRHDLIASVVDVVENQGIRTAIIDASFACHMPDCLEMPYKPTISESVELKIRIASIPYRRQFMPERRFYVRLDFS